MASVVAELPSPNETFAPEIPSPFRLVITPVNVLEDVRMKVEAVDGVNNVEVNLVFEPEWDKDMMTEEAKLELGFL